MYVVPWLAGKSDAEKNQEFVLFSRKNNQEGENESEAI